MITVALALVRAIGSGIWHFGFLQILAEIPGNFAKVEMFYFSGIFYPGNPQIIIFRCSNVLITGDIVHMDE